MVGWLFTVAEGRSITITVTADGKYVLVISRGLDGHTVTFLS